MATTSESNLLDHEKGRKHQRRAQRAAELAAERAEGGAATPRPGSPAGGAAGSPDAAGGVASAPPMAGSRRGARLELTGGDMGTTPFSSLPLPSGAPSKPSPHISNYMDM